MTATTPYTRLFPGARTGNELWLGLAPESFYCGLRLASGCPRLLTRCVDGANNAKAGSQECDNSQNKPCCQKLCARCLARTDSCASKTRRRAARSGTCPENARYARAQYASAAPTESRCRAGATQTDKSHREGVKIGARAQLLGRALEAWLACTPAQPTAGTPSPACHSSWQPEPQHGTSARSAARLGGLLAAASMAMRGVARAGSSEHPSLRVATPREDGLDIISTDDSDVLRCTVCDESPEWITAAGECELFNGNRMVAGVDAWAGSALLPCGSEVRQLVSLCGSAVVVGKARPAVRPVAEVLGLAQDLAPSRRCVAACRLLSSLGSPVSGICGVWEGLVEGRSRTVVVPSVDSSPVHSATAARLRAAAAMREAHPLRPWPFVAVADDSVGVDVVVMSQVGRAPGWRASIAASGLLLCTSDAGGVDVWRDSLLAGTSGPGAQSHCPGVAEEGKSQRQCRTSGSDRFTLVGCIQAHWRDLTMPCVVGGSWLVACPGGALSVWPLQKSPGKGGEIPGVLAEAGTLGRPGRGAREVRDAPVHLVCASTTVVVVPLGPREGRCLSIWRFGQGKNPDHSPARASSWKLIADITTPDDDDGSTWPYLSDDGTTVAVASESRQVEIFSCLSGARLAILDARCPGPPADLEAAWRKAAGLSVAVADHTVVAQWTHGRLLCWRFSTAWNRRKYLLFWRARLH